MLHIMTMNLNLYEEKHGQWPQRRRVIEDAVRGHSVDVMALQAVQRHPRIENGVDQGAQLAASLGFSRKVFRASSRTADGCDDGLSLISKRPLEEVDSRGLRHEPRSTDSTTRILLSAVIPLASSRLQIVNVHLSFVPEQNAVNIDDLLAFLRERPLLTVIVGDFSAKPDAPPLKRLVEAGYIDAWTRKRPNEPGFTFPSHKPDRRIDFAFLSPSLAPALVDVKLAATGTDGVRGSDHYGLVVSLDI